MPVLETTSPTAHQLHPPWAWLGFRLSLKNAWSTWNHPFGIWDKKTSSLTSAESYTKGSGQGIGERAQKHEPCWQKTLLPPWREATDVYGGFGVVFHEQMVLCRKRRFSVQQGGGSRDSRGMTAMVTGQSPWEHCTHVLQHKELLGDIPCLT